MGSFLSSKKMMKIIAFGIMLLVMVLAIDSVYQSFAPDSLPSSYTKGHIQLSHNQKKKDLVVNSLEHQIEDLKKMLELKTKQLEQAKEARIENSEFSEVFDKLDLFSDGDSIVHFLNEKIQTSQVLHGSSRGNEYDMNTFSFFNRNNIYTLKPGLSQKTQVSWSRLRGDKREISEVISEGIRVLNDGSERRFVSPTYRFTDKDFLHGIYRTEKSIGTQYKLVYQPKSSRNIVNKHQLVEVEFFRPYAPLKKIDVELIEEDEVVHFVIPLTKRSDTFKVFVDYFKEAALPDGNVHLTVVFHGEESLGDVKNILESFRKDTGFLNYSLVTSNEKFSRGKALHLGINSIKSKNPLLFFCDVDMAFTADFLNQCRSHTSRGKSVFFPIVFSLYNPELVYENSVIPDLRSRQLIKRTHGFWRDFGFGMSCMYKNDYKHSGGFDLNISGWGTEDLLLYRKFARSSMKVVRTPVNSLFHHWHTKICDKSWPDEQYHSCLKSRVRTEGSAVQLGMQYFKLKDELSTKSKS